MAVAQYGIPHADSAAAPCVTLSLGVTHVQPPLTADLTTESLFHAADAALYQAKNQGRNRSVMQRIETVRRPEG
jgi:PleD family two-component response regulator